MVFERAKQAYAIRRFKSAESELREVLERHALDGGFEHHKELAHQISVSLADEYRKECDHARLFDLSGELDFRPKGSMNRALFSKTIIENTQKAFAAHKDRLNEIIAAKQIADKQHWRLENFRYLVNRLSSENGKKVVEGCITQGEEFNETLYNLMGAIKKARLGGEESGQLIDFALECARKNDRKRFDLVSQCVENGKAKGLVERILRIGRKKGFESIAQIRNLTIRFGPESLNPLLDFQEKVFEEGTSNEKLEGFMRLQRLGFVLEKRAGLRLVSLANFILQNHGWEAASSFLMELEQLSKNHRTDELHARLFASP